MYGSDFFRFSLTGGAVSGIVIGVETLLADWLLAALTLDWIQW